MSSNEFQIAIHAIERMRKEGSKHLANIIEIWLKAKYPHAWSRWANRSRDI